MSKYHLGDKFIVEVKEVLESNNGTLYRSNFSTLVFDDYGLDKLQKYDEIGHKLELIDELKQAEYNRGLADAWELAKKIGCVKEEGGMSCDVLEDVYGLAYAEDVFAQYAVEEALAKIEAYEKKKEIKVGDVVNIFHNGSNGVVVRINESGGFNVVLENGLFYADCVRGDLIKTGKHIDIESLLRQIGE